MRGELPSPLNVPTGCAFRTRCPHAFGRCAAERPALRLLEGGQEVACHLDDPAAGSGYDAAAGAGAPAGLEVTG
nr:oligopeptide/dipeptide ABC transporter ATP-binding protein [Deinococcus cavernae]